MSLSARLQRSLQATATLTIAELHNEGQSAANNAEEWPYAQISEILDRATCRLCRRVDGKIVKVGSPEYRKWRGPSHINCRRTMVYIHRDEPNVQPDFEEPEAELIRKHGHYHTQPEKHAELRIPAEPAGRHVIVRRVKHLETGEIRTKLDWAPHWERVAQWKRDLVLKARATRDEVELAGILERLGLTDVSLPEQYHQLTLLGLRDRVDGWVTNFPGPPWKNPNAPTVLVAQAHPEAEAWALANLPGLKQVDYSGMDLDVANEFNRVISDITTKFGISVPVIMPRDWPGWLGAGIPRIPNAPMVSNLTGLVYNPVDLQGEGKRRLLNHLLSRKLFSEASRSIPAYVAHEMAHQLVLRTQEMTWQMAAAQVRKREAEFIVRRTPAVIRAELGDYAIDGGGGELFAEAFSAYWENIYSVSPETKAFVEEIFGILYPGLKL